MHAFLRNYCHEVMACPANHEVFFTLLKTVDTHCERDYKFCEPVIQCLLANGLEVRELLRFPFS